MFSLVPVFATTHFYDAFKFMTALNKTSFKNIFAFSFNWSIKQFLHILPASVYPFSAQQPGCTKGYYHIGL